MNESKDENNLFEQSQSESSGGDWRLSSNWTNSSNLFQMNLHLGRHRSNVTQRARAIEISIVSMNFRPLFGSCFSVKETTIQIPKSELLYLEVLWLALFDFGILDAENRNKTKQNLIQIYFKMRTRL
jgi:hypothetical protein